MKRVLLAAVVAGLVLALYLGLRTSQTQRDREAQAERRLLPDELSAFDGLQGVWIERRDEEPAQIRLERRGDRWWLVDPLEARASGPGVRSLAERLGELEAERWIEADPDVDYGFRPPAWRVAVTSATGASAVVEIGRSTPFGGRIYARRAGSDAIAVIAGGFQYNLSKPLAEFRDRAVFAEFPGAISQAELQAGHETWRFVHDGTGGWRDDSRAELDAGRLESWLSRIRYLSVRDFLDGPEADEAFADGDASRMIRLQATDGRWLALRFGHVDAETQQVALRLEGADAAVTISKHVYDELWPRPEALQPGASMDDDPGDGIDGLSVDGPGHDFHDHHDHP